MSEKSLDQLIKSLKTEAIEAAEKEAEKILADAKRASRANSANGAEEKNGNNCWRRPSGRQQAILGTKGKLPFGRRAGIIAFRYGTNYSIFFSLYSKRKPAKNLPRI